MSEEPKCPLHDGLVEWIKEERSERKEVMVKLDKLIEKQAEHHEEIMHVRSIVSDGLQTKVRETAERVDIICKKVIILEDFKWFRDWVTGLRDHVFESILKIGVWGGAIYAAIHFGNKFVEAVMK